MGRWCTYPHAAARVVVSAAISAGGLRDDATLVTYSYLLTPLLSPSHTRAPLHPSRFTRHASPVMPHPSPLSQSSPGAWWLQYARRWRLLPLPPEIEEACRLAPVPFSDRSGDRDHSGDYSAAHARLGSGAAAPRARWAAGAPPRHPATHLPPYLPPYLPPCGAAGGEVSEGPRGSPTDSHPSRRRQASMEGRQEGSMVGA